jgi:hypothetical protein
LAKKGELEQTSISNPGSLSPLRGMITLEKEDGGATTTTRGKEKGGVVGGEGEGEGRTDEERRVKIRC